MTPLAKTARKNPPTQPGQNRKIRANLSYAKAAAGAYSTFIVRRDGKQPHKDDLEAVETAINICMLKMMEEDDSGDPWTPCVERWELAPDGIILEVKDKRTASFIGMKALATTAYRQLTELELQERNKPRIELTGFVRGSTANISEEGLALFLKKQVAQLKINGSLTLKGMRKTPKGGILSIRVDDEAEQSLGEHGHVLYIGAAGPVRFHNLKGTTASSRSREARKEQLQSELEEASRVAEDLKKQLMAVAEEENTDVDLLLGMGDMDEGNPVAGQDADMLDMPDKQGDAVSPNLQGTSDVTQ